MSWLGTHVRKSVHNESTGIPCFFSRQDEFQKMTSKKCQDLEKFIHFDSLLTCPQLLWESSIWMIPSQVPLLEVKEPWITRYHKANVIRKNAISIHKQHNNGIQGQERAGLVMILAHAFQLLHVFTSGSLKSPRDWRSWTCTAFLDATACYDWIC